MSESSDSGPGRREVAHRLFAAEFEDAEFSYSESDEERAPNYVVTPTGARVNRLFVTGVLTELEQVNDDVLRARIVDPTGAFVVYAGQYQPEALAFLEAATPPLFVAVTGKARTFEPEDGDRVFTSVRPESISEVDAETRDRWVVQAAEQTVARVGRLASARQSELSGDPLQQALVDAGVSESDAAGATLALDYYDTTGDYLQAARDLALNAARVVAGERDEAGSLSRSPGDGTDGPLAVLATMDLESPSDGSSAESGVEAVGTETTESTAGAETATTDAETADAETAEPATETTPATEETSSGSEPTAPATATDDASSTDPTADPSTAGDETEGAPSTDPIAEPSAAGDESDGTTATTESESTPTASESTQSQPEAEPADESADEGSSDTLGDFDSSGDAATTDLGATEQESTVDSATVADNETDDEVGDFDTEFELDEDEREEIEAEYGTDFQSGTEVDDAGEAGIETPDPEDLAEAEAAAGADEPSDAGSAPDSHSATAEEATDAEATAEPPAEDVDLEDAVMDVMSDLNDGSGADREAVITDVVDTYGADRDAVEDAIQDALMGGRCYEPDDDKLTPI